MEGDEVFPRDLTIAERDLLLWILPEERSGYNEYRRLVQEWKVVARGRRGEGNYILAAAGETADNESPLPQVLAYGIIETDSGQLSVGIRERFENQVEFEISSVRGNVDPNNFRELRRWTYSYWLPKQLCPICGDAAREVSMKTSEGRNFVLALCARDQRLWVYDEMSGINHPIPVTNFYNELMLHKNIRDPKFALDFKRLFSDLSTFTDADLIHAFRTYNKIRTKVSMEGNIVVEEPKPSLWKKLLQFFGK